MLGRCGGVWAVPWDQHISRQHVRLQWTGERLEVIRLPDARNPVYFLGKEQTQFSLRPGEHFVISRTTFTLADQRVSVTAHARQPVQQQSFSSEYLNQVQFRNPDHRLEVLSRLPQVTSGATGDRELTLESEASTLRVAYLDDGRIVTTSFDGTLRLFDGTSARQLAVARRRIHDSWAPSAATTLDGGGS